MKILTGSTLVLVLVLAGCETHHSMSRFPSNPMASAMAECPEQAFTDRDIATRLDARVRAKLPTNLAIAKLGTNYSGPYVETIGAEELHSWEKVVADEPLITGVQPIVPVAISLSEKDKRISLKSLREAAGTQNCELLLVYLQDDRDLENLNGASILYWTIVGLWVVPGTDLEHRTVCQAVLVDSRTGAVLGTATGEDEHRRTTPAAWTSVGEEKIVKQTTEKSLKDLQTGCRRLIAEVVLASRTASR